jgi:hypothetical protein
MHWGTKKFLHSSPIHFHFPFDREFKGLKNFIVETNEGAELLNIIDDANGTLYVPLRCPDSQSNDTQHKEQDTAQQT